MSEELILVSEHIIIDCFVPFWNIIQDLFFILCEYKLEVLLDIFQGKRVQFNQILPYFWEEGQRDASDIHHADHSVLGEKVEVCAHEVSPIRVKDQDDRLAFWSRVYPFIQNLGPLYEGHRLPFGILLSLSQLVRSKLNQDSLPWEAYILYLFLGRRCTKKIDVEELFFWKFGFSRFGGLWRIVDPGKIKFSEGSGEGDGEFDLAFSPRILEVPILLWDF